MKKIWGVLVILLAVVTLISCSNSAHKAYNSKTESENVSLKRKVKVNKKHWNKMTSAAVIEYLPGSTNFDDVFPSTWHDMKNENNYIIEGTIVNYEKMEHQPLLVETKATIHVDKVLSGSKVLEHQYIVTTVPMGFAFSKDIKSSVEGSSDQKNTEVLYRQTNFPLPKIGSQIITGIKSNKKKFDQNRSFKKEMAKYDLSGSDSYLITEPNYNFWIKNADGKFIINNLDIRNMKQDNPNYDKVYSLVELTKQLDSKTK
ncbi:hypothetical protein [Companilactobacillus jidongensis]|uniref:hypothetical protein n=1 Tax=Companilactobacillus jidongensis TaxID=2486006 RepID=UPI000F78D8C9|nr:hypothetical protein [Companilactobacillus jidongensis]